MKDHQNFPPTKPYDQQPGEPDKWFEHFQHYCQMGPSRSIDSCYRHVKAQHDGLPGGPGSSKIRAPGYWKRKAREFDWSDRASVWDSDRHQRVLQRQEEILDMFSKAAREAIQYLLDTMRGQVVEPDGTITIIHDHYERRMAAKTLFSKWVDVLAILQEEPDESAAEVKITEIFVHKSPNGSHKCDQEKKFPENEAL